MEIYEPFSVRVTWWMKSKLMFNTNKQVKVADNSEKIEALKKQLKHNAKI